MCGLAAVVRLTGEPIPEAALDRMVDALRHRGPDDAGRVSSSDQRVAMGFRRLSIIDLSAAGHQPMLSPDGRLAIVFNGEIYNYIELRAELRGLGHTFRSTGDTEVLLAAYRQWGRDCLARLNGMWAFMVLDLVDGTVFGARDRFGVKPLFYYQSDKYLLIASEIKAIRRSGLYHGGIDGDAAARFMANDELDVGAGTFFEGIRRIAAGHQFEIGRDGILRTASYWTLPSRAYAGHADPVERFTEIIDDAIRIRMRSDVPVGILLSGGLDSTSILCRAVGQAGANGGSMHAFSYMPEQYQEHQQISDTIAATGAILHRLDSDPLRMWSAIEPMLRAQDEPVHSMTAVVHYRLMQAAREHGIKVVLVGQGADESLAGYPNYFNAYHSALLRQGKIGRLWAELGAFIDTHGGNRGERLISHARSALMGLVSNLAVYRGLSEARREQRMLLGGWLVSDVVRRAKPRAVPPPGMDLRAELAYSMEVTSLPLYLRIEDRNSMAHSIEARLPFMDYRLVSFAFELADEWKLRGGWNKFILREAMRGRIPESVRTRPGKLGFPTPVDAWMRGALAEPVREVLTDPSLARRGLYRPGVIEEGLRRHIAGEADLGARLFDVVQFELWQQIIERETVSALAA